MKSNTKPQFIISIFLDIFFGIYFCTVFYRILWLQVLSTDSIPQNSMPNEVLIYVISGSILGIALNLLNVSPAKKIYGQIAKNSWQDKIAQNILWILAVLTIVTGWTITKISAFELFSRQGLEGAGRIFYALFTPNFSIFNQAFVAIIETIYLALMATLFALPVSFLLGFLSARNLMKSNPTAFAIYNVLRILSNFTRSIEPLIWAIVFSVWVGIGPFAGMLALMIHTIASLSKQYSEQIEDIDRGPMEAIEATGARPLQVVWFAVVPQIIIPFLSFTIYRWDINVRMATIIGMVGGGGIGTLLMQYQGLAKWNEVGLIVLLIALVVWLMDYISAKIREVIQ